MKRAILFLLVTAVAVAAVAAVAALIRPQPATGWQSDEQLEAGHQFKNILTISCPTPQFCLAGDVNGLVYEYLGHRWRSEKQLDAGSIESITCVNSDFCVALADGSRPTSNLTINASSPLLLTYRNSRWSRAKPIPYASLACSARGNVYCLAVSDTQESGEVQSFAYTSSLGWSREAVFALAAPEYVSAISCAAPGECEAVTAAPSGGEVGGHALRYNDARWDEPRSITKSFDLYAVSCASPEWCVATTNDGAAVSETNGVWGGNVQVVRPAYSGYLSSVSCPTRYHCVAVDTAGNAYVFDGGAWSGPVNLGTNDVLNAVSCPTTTMCGAVGDGGAFIYRAKSG